MHHSDANHSDDEADDTPDESVDHSLHQEHIDSSDTHAESQTVDSPTPAEPRVTRTRAQPARYQDFENLKLDKGDEEERVDANQYRRLIGRLLYLQATRPDITYSVNILSQFVSDPKQSHWNAALRILRYLKTTIGQGILLPREGATNLVAYSDSDWLGCPYSRRSRTGYLLLLGGAPVSWKSKKQSVVSRSSAEAEYRAMATTVSEVLWVRWLLSELDMVITTPTSLMCDNESAKHILIILSSTNVRSTWKWIVTLFGNG
ncbi:hypothetical protein L1887_23945 [Cichorium endivia]|nr:hypothetical protein L1887_23945 [Cichorium endivia]